MAKHTRIYIDKALVAKLEALQANLDYATLGDAANHAIRAFFQGSAPLPQTEPQPQPEPTITYNFD